MYRILFLTLSLLYSWAPMMLQGAEETPKVLIAILARNKEHFLPLYLDCIDKLDYPKKSIHIYINTNNNEDDTVNILNAWVKQHESEYAKVVMENYDINDNPFDAPHLWDTKRFKILGGIRQKSMEETLKQKCDYYFVIDCDNFVKPLTLKTLVEKKKPIIAPMLQSVPIPGHLYSNFFYAVDAKGYYKEDPRYVLVLRREIEGTVKVPVVHCTYLIDAKYIPKLTYLDGTDDFEFVVFARSARNNDVSQWICNEIDFGKLWCTYGLPEESLQEERQSYKNFMKCHPNFP